MKHWKLRVSAAASVASAAIVWWLGLVDVPGWVWWLTPALPLIWLVVWKRPITVDELRALRLEILKRRLARITRKERGLAMVSDEVIADLWRTGQPGAEWRLPDGSILTWQMVVAAYERVKKKAAEAAAAALRAASMRVIYDEPIGPKMLTVAAQLHHLVTTADRETLARRKDWIADKVSEEIQRKAELFKSDAMRRLCLTVYLGIDGDDDYTIADPARSDFKAGHLKYIHPERPYGVKEFEAFREMIENLWGERVFIERCELGGVSIRPWPNIEQRIPLAIDAGAGLVFGTDLLSGDVVRLKASTIPHLLIMGTSGFGKSVFLHQLVSQLIAAPMADVAQVVLIDLKGGVEFRQYQREGDDRVTVVWDFETAMQVVDELVEIMETRLAAMVERRVREWPGERVFFIVDEFAQIQLYPIEGKEGKASHERMLANLNRLSMLGRAAGIVICAAIQKATTDVMDSSFRNNLQGQICFRVPNRLAAASMFGSTDELKVDPVTLSRGRFVFYDPTAGAVRYLQAHIAEGAL